MSDWNKADELTQELYNALASVVYLCRASIRENVPEVAKLAEDCLRKAQNGGVCANTHLLMHPVRELDGYEFTKKCD